jgi:hypothetical protein
LTDGSLTFCVIPTFNKRRIATALESRVVHLKVEYAINNFAWTYLYLLADKNRSLGIGDGSLITVHELKKNGVNAIKQKTGTKTIEILTLSLKVCFGYIMNQVSFK